MTLQVSVAVSNARLDAIETAVGASPIMRATINSPLIGPWVRPRWPWPVATKIRSPGN